MWPKKGKLDALYKKGWFHHVGLLISTKRGDLVFDPGFGIQLLPIRNWVETSGRKDRKVNLRKAPWEIAGQPSFFNIENGMNLGDYKDLIKWR